MAAIIPLARGDLRAMPRELRPSANAMASLDSRPPSASLINLSTNERYDFLFNPQSFDEKFEAKYDRTQIIGLSHERLSYKNTSNNVVPLELYLSQLAQDQRTGTAGSSPTIMSQKAWLQSLVYPASSQDFGYVGPPQVLFVWPGSARMIGRITKVSFLHRAFSNRNLHSTQIVAKIEFEEDVERRRLMEDVQRNGSVIIEEDI